MKKEKDPGLIFRDKEFEDQTRQGIKEVFDGLVKLVSIWDECNVGPCSDLWQLVNFASKTYSDAFQANVEVPAELGKYQIRKDVFLNLVSVPTPNNLYVQAKAIQKMPCFGYQNIWNLQDGPFTLVGKHFPHLSMLTLEVEQLRLIIEKL